MLKREDISRSMKNQVKTTDVLYISISTDLQAVTRGFALCRG
jgi:hypothetical protein